jgi:hypothetical protein
MADTHTLQEIIEKTIQTTLLKAHPVGSYWLTESDDDPNTLFGGGWERVKGKLLQCSDDTHPAGTDIEAGLPNITGNVQAVGESGEEGSWLTNLNGAGCFYAVTVNASRQYYASCVVNYNGGTNYQGFDASRCSSIYGKSDTVQPETHVVNVWKRIS